MVSGKIVAVAVILIVIIVVAGLAVYYYDAYHRLTFNLDSVGLGSATLTSAEINFIVAVSNPRPLPIYIPSGDFDAYINDQHLGKGYFNSLTVGGNSQSLITVPVTFNFTDVPSALYGIITGGGNITVTIQGSADLTLFRVPFNATLYNASIT